jgi:hypothetical protein
VARGQRGIGGPQFDQGGWLAADELIQPLVAEDLHHLVGVAGADRHQTEPCRVDEVTGLVGHAPPSLSPGRSPGRYPH